MDASFFRFVLYEIEKFLVGSIIEKVYHPLDSVWTFKLSKKHNLIFRFGARENFIFLSKNRPENPIHPNPQVGWWRKRVQKRRIEEVITHWPLRIFILKLSPTNHSFGDFIVFDLKQGISLKNEIQQKFNPIKWPNLQEIIYDNQIYKRYPHITSPFRYSLISIDPENREQCYKSFIEGKIEDFYVYEKNNTYRLDIWKRVDLSDFWEIHFQSANEAAEYYGWQILNGFKETSKSLKKIENRTKKLVEDQKKKLEQWLKLEDVANLIKINLNRFDPNGHYNNIEVHASNGERINVELDPSKTLIQNMNLMFKKVKKAKRGLKILENREVENFKKVNFSNELNIETKKIPLPSRIFGLKVKVYKSSDGFYIVSGKNQKANHKLLSFGARAHDLWMHAQGGPGAHVIIIRDNPKKEIPQRTLIEAAIIAGRLSYQKESDYLDVICTEVRYVKKRKGQGLGEVEVTKVLNTLRVKNNSYVDLLRIS